MKYLTVNKRLKFKTIQSDFTCYRQWRLRPCTTSHSDTTVRRCRCI